MNQKAGFTRHHACHDLTMDSPVYRYEKHISVVFNTSVWYFVMVAFTDYDRLHVVEFVNVKNLDSSLQTFLV